MVQHMRDRHTKSSEYGYIAEATKQRLPVAAWNETAVPFPDTICIHELFEDQAQRHPQAPAAIFAGALLTYGELNTRANQLAHYLRHLGVGPETLVGICMERSLDMLVAIFGVLKAGGAYVPLDPTYPRERLAFIVEEAQIPIMLTRRTEDWDAASDRQQPIVIALQRDWDQIAEESCSNPRRSQHPGNLAYVIYTSGSSGEPKGVLLEHRGLVNLVLNMIDRFELTHASRVLQFASLSFDGSVCEIFTALSGGATLYLAHRSTLVSPPDLVNFLREHAITVAALPPSLLAVIRPDDVPGLRTVISAGEACSWEIALAWAKGRRFLNAYGPTEVTVGPTCYHVTAHIPNTRTVPIGSPMPNYQMFILDEQHQQVPVGMPGEIYIAGVGLARGYLNRPQLTAERFLTWTVDDPQAPSFLFQRDRTSVRVYKTGDRARYLPDGSIEFLGRVDHQVKLRGFRIELGEIEAILRRHPSVQNAVVLLREDTPGDQRLVGYVTTNQSPTSATPPIQPDDLRAYLRDYLAAYMVPAVIIMMPALPLTVNGKVDRQALPTPLAAANEPETTATPRTPEEAALVNIWAQMLGRTSVGIHDDFFALGGHSLLAVRTIALINATLNLNLSLRMLYDAPTVAGFAEMLGQTHEVVEPNWPHKLAEDVALDPEIFASTPAPDVSVRPGAILLTGATGYLGAYLLHELLVQTDATIYCLVRSVDARQANRRLQKTLMHYRLWRDEWINRIVAVVGDLSRPQLGLSTATFTRLATTIDVIYHSAAQVHYLHPYSTLKQANVRGTVEILRLASQERTKPVHFVSTLAVAAGANDYVAEDDAQAECDSALGYVQSKWVAEGVIRLARKRGVPVTIYRPGRIGCDSRTGIINPDDFFVRLLAGCVQVGLAPDVPLQENLVPVDYTAQAIVHLSRQPAPATSTYHLVNPASTRWDWVIQVTRAAGYPLRLVSYTEWRNAMLVAAAAEPDHALQSLVMLIPEDQSTAIWIDSWTKKVFATTNTDAGLNGSGIWCPPIDSRMLIRMLRAMTTMGWFNLAGVRRGRRLDTHYLAEPVVQTGITR